MLPCIPSHGARGVGVYVADSAAGHSPPPVVSLAPLIALLSLLSNRERDSVCRLVLLPSTDTKRTKSWPFHYWFSPACKGAKMSSFGWLYFLIIYTSKELFTRFVSHLSLPLSIHLCRSHLLPLSGLSRSDTLVAYMQLKINLRHLKVIENLQTFNLKLNLFTASQFRDFERCSRVHIGTFHGTKYLFFVVAAIIR